MALKNVVIGYAKGDKGDKGDTGERGETGQTGPQGESGNIADAAITDTQGLDVAKGAKTTAQKLFDAIADRIVNKLVTNETLTTKLADYLLKSAMSSTNINSTTNVPTSALVYSLLQDVNNNLSNSGIPIVKKITDLYSIKTSGFYYYDAGTTNAPQSSRGGMIIANYLSDSWISLIVVPYASSKIYTNTKYNNTWVGWAESATKNDFVIKTYTIAGKAVNAETIADFEPNIALSGYTPLGIVGTRLNAYGSVTLVYADLVDDTKARVRVRNNGTESVTGDNVIIRVLYFKS